jgi:hypothetical protein
MEQVQAESKPKWLPLLESASKGAALLALTCYAFGFIVVSVNDASFGFSELSPFKPRILSAGLLFSVLTAVPIMSAQWIFRTATATDYLTKVAWVLSRCWLHLVASLILVAALKPIFVDVPGDTGRVPFWGWWLLTLAVLAILALTGFAVVSYEKFPGLVSLFFAALLGLIGWWLFYDSSVHPSSVTCLWFFAVGLTPVVLRRIAKQQGLSIPMDVAYPVMLAISFFPTHIYPRIKHSWGGGEPATVVAYFSQDARLFPGQQIRGKLLDESDQGFYLLLDDQTRALYVPRGAVAALFFSDHALNAAAQTTTKPGTDGGSPF